MSERSVSLGEIARVFLKIGAMSYGGPAIMGIMQTEVQEKRRWIEKQEFIEGLALVNMLPGPGATHVGTIGLRSGNPATTTSPREWRCGFYPGSEPGERSSGTAAMFREACNA